MIGNQKSREKPRRKGPPLFNSVFQFSLGEICATAKTINNGEEGKMEHVEHHDLIQPLCSFLRELEET